MSRIDRIFQDLAHRRAKALMPFITAGDPDLATTEALLPALEQAGASVVELGIPFSDPIADGPVIEGSMTRALNNGVTLAEVLAMVRSVRPHVSLGLVAMVSYSIVYRYGLERFLADAAAAGIDGFIFPDLPVDEAGPAQAAVQQKGLTMSLLVAPTTPIDRAKQIAAASSGFVYVVSRAGTTGEQGQLPEALSQRLSELRKVTDLPLAVGFGIGRPEHVRQVVAEADAAIVGSALMRQVNEHRQADRASLVEAVGRFTRELASGLNVDTTNEPADVSS
jgi:tryptophan synthase alpha chain